MIRERTTTQTRNNKCVVTSMPGVVTVPRLAWHPREHAQTLDVVDDRVQEEGALQPRLVPLRVHEGGVHGPVQELQVEQDAVDVLHCGSTQNRLFAPLWIDNLLMSSPQGEWDKLAGKMMVILAESGYPVFRATRPLSRGRLKSKGGGKLSTHYCADSETIETVFRTFTSVNQLSLYGAVVEMCE